MSPSVPVFFGKVSAWADGGSPVVSASPMSAPCYLLSCSRTFRQEGSRVDRDDMSKYMESRGHCCPPERFTWDLSICVGRFQRHWRQSASHVCKSTESTTLQISKEPGCPRPSLLCPGPKTKAKSAKETIHRWTCRYEMRGRHLSHTVCRYPGKLHWKYNFKS